jgi:hypothetical protein
MPRIVRHEQNLDGVTFWLRHHDILWQVNVTEDALKNFGPSPLDAFADQKETLGKIAEAMIDSDRIEVFEPLKIDLEDLKRLGL